jgi:hypothetical protein
LTRKEFGEWTGSGLVTARIDAPYDTFVRLLLGGIVVDPSKYIVTEGSTIITLRESYLKTLADGEYSFTAVFSNGTANILLKVNKGAVDDNNPDDESGKGENNGDDSGKNNGATPTNGNNGNTTPISTTDPRTDTGANNVTDNSTDNMNHPDSGPRSINEATDSPEQTIDDGTTPLAGTTVESDAKDEATDGFPWLLVGLVVVMAAIGSLAVGFLTIRKRRIG